MRTRLLFPMLGLLLLGAGCALSSADKDRQVSQMLTPDDAQAAAATKSEPSSDDTVFSADAEIGVGEEEAIDPSEGAPREVDLSAGNFFFSPTTITAKTGERIIVKFSAADGTHDFVIDEANVKEHISAGGTVVVTAPSTPGHYTYYSDIGADRTLGMTGELIVQ